MCEKYKTIDKVCTHERLTFLNRCHACRAKICREYLFYWYENIQADDVAAGDVKRRAPECRAGILGELNGLIWLLESTLVIASDAPTLRMCGVSAGVHLQFTVGETKERIEKIDELRPGEKGEDEEWRNVTAGRWNVVKDEFYACLASEEVNKSLRLSEALLSAYNLFIGLAIGGKEEVDAYAAEKKLKAHKID